MTLSTPSRGAARRPRASRQRRHPACLLACLPGAVLSPAWAADDVQPFGLGVVEVTGTRASDTSTSVGAAVLRREDAATVGQALDLVPGVVISKVGARNEQMVQVRGFDLRQTPVFIDGVPVYVPYDGYVDLGRFFTYDLARVQVEKGYSSMLYGANTLGGAINLVGRRPSHPWEVDAGSGWVADRDASPGARWAYVNAGLRRDEVWAQLGSSVYAQDSLPMAAGTAPTKAEDGGARNNSDALDRKLSLKIGWTPNAEDEYTLNVIDQDGSKGTPPYAGQVSTVTPRYWRWPLWDKRSIYLSSRTRLADLTLKLRAFRDSFRNALFAYDDATYTTQAKASSYRSWYDDDSQGASAQLDWPVRADNTLGMAAHWKEDVHREHNAGEPVRRFKDVTTSFALEDTHRLSEQTSLVAGLGRDHRSTQQAQGYNSTTKVISEFTHGEGSTTNGQLALRQALPAQWQLQASVARKSRFPTLKDRYSYRLGTAIPNADLAPERATHFELALSGAPLADLTVQAAIFRSNIRDLIQSVAVSTLCGTAKCNQTQNIGRARAAGAELSAAWRAGAWALDGHYQYLDRDNLSSPSVRLTDTPRHQARLHAAYQPLPDWTLHADLAGGSARYTSSDGVQVAAGFGVLNLKAAWQVTPQASLEAAVHNVADRRYAYAEGFPEPGRQLLLQGRLAWY